MLKTIGLSCAKQTSLGLTVSRFAPVGSIQARQLSDKAVKKRVDFYYDIISPYAWVGYELMLRCNKEWRADFRLHPVSLMELVKDTGNAVPPVRVKYGLMDVMRNAKHYDIPMKIPSNIGEYFQKGTHVPLSFLAALELEHPEYLDGVTRQLWRRIYSKNQDVSSLESVIEACKRAGLEEYVINATSKRVDDPAVKAKLDANKEAAMSHGAFGVPSFLVTNGTKQTLLWGSDRFQLMAELLDKPEPSSLLHKKST